MKVSPRKRWGQNKQNHVEELCEIFLIQAQKDEMLEADSNLIKEGDNSLKQNKDTRRQALYKLFLSIFYKERRRFHSQGF